MQNAFLLKTNKTPKSQQHKTPQTIYLSHFFPEEMPS